MIPWATIPRLVLASASPARLKLLRAAGIDADVQISGVDETRVRHSDPSALCEALARLKAEAVVASNARSPQRSEALVLGCDSVLAFHGQVFGKPADAAEATARWLRLRGDSGVLHTGHCLIDTATGRLAEEVATTTVHFANVTDSEIESYVSTGEPLRVAGAFTIDGLGGPFVERIDGDAGAVIGLSLPTLRRLVQALGFNVTDFWRQGSRASQLA